MNSTPFAIEPLDAQARDGFDCGVAELDHYFKSQVGQDVRRRATKCFVCTEVSTGRTAGFYTLSATDVALGELPEDLVRRLPRYPRVPMAMIGRLAVDRAFRGIGLGSTLLVNAAARAARADLAVFGLVVEAKDEVAAAFYAHHGFKPLASAEDQMIAPIASFRALIGG